MEDGEGLQRLIPPLNSSSFISENRELLPCIIKYGIDRPIEVVWNLMDEIVEKYGKRLPDVTLYEEFEKAV